MEARHITLVLAVGLIAHRAPDGLSHDERYFEKMQRYARDGGASTLNEVVALLGEASAS